MHAGAVSHKGFAYEQADSVARLATPTSNFFRNCFEGAFLEDYFDKLRRELRESFHQWTFHILHHNQAFRPIRFPYYGKGHVLLWFSDESSGSADDAAANFEHVFKSYALPSPCPPNVHPFPLFGASAVFHKDFVSFDDRKYQVFFSGNLNRQRAVLFLRLKFPILDTLPSLPLGRMGERTLSIFSKCLRAINPNIHSLPSSFIRFNGGFATGITRDEYADVLARSQVCLCPPGFITQETMRHYEAMKLGCVVLCETLPQSPYYSGSPIIQLESWRGIHNTITDLLSKPAQLRSIASATRSWWLEKCSPSAAAHETAMILVNR